jgi:two-component system response regulator RegA
VNCIVVEDDDLLCRALAPALGDWGARVTVAATFAGGRAALAGGPQLMIFDVGLPDGSGVDLAELAATSRPAPLMVAISGRASAAEAFRLGQLGVRGYLPKPLSFADFTCTLEGLLAQAPDLSPLLVAAVGQEPFQDVLEQVRRTMTEQALALSGGNRTTAARLLGVTRQAVQYIVRDLDLATDRPASEEAVSRVTSRQR